MASSHVLVTPISDTESLASTCVAQCCMTAGLRIFHLHTAGYWGCFDVRERTRTRYCMWDSWDARTRQVHALTQFMPTSENPLLTSDI